MTAQWESFMKKAHLEILLEDIRGKFDLVLEGHAALDEKFSKRFDELAAKIDMNSFKIDVLNKKIDSVDERLNAKIDSVEARLHEKIDSVETQLRTDFGIVADNLAAHRADTETHHGLYLVKEG
jgi:phosphopantetheine adenylyltransferase